MGRESRMHRERVCPGCKVIFIFTAEQFKTHINVCERLSKVGLVLPTGIASPKTSIKRIIEP